jgi:hypothetical protein
MINRRATCWFIILPLALTPLACRSKAGESRVYSVRGSVVYQGKPTPGAVVTFFPVGGGTGTVLPHAEVEDDGTFQLTTYKLKDGAPAGKYDVSVMWTKPGHGDDGGEMLIPIQYGNPHTSDLHAEIKEQPNELPPFQLQPERRGSRR